MQFLISGFIFEMKTDIVLILYLWYQLMYSEYN